MHTLPQLYKNRLCIYYLRLICNGRETKAATIIRDYAHGRGVPPQRAL